MVEDLDKWRKAGKIAAEVLDYACSLVKPGVSLLEVAEKTEAKIKETMKTIIATTKALIASTVLHVLFQSIMCHQVIHQIGHGNSSIRNKECHSCQDYEELKSHLIPPHLRLHQLH